LETQVRTPQAIFMQPQRLIVPLFQRPYVWSRENQWEPLWDDVQRVAERLLADPSRKQHPHFLGAVVLQQAPKPTGSLQERTVIDGQQRLTTLQILLDALHAEFLAVDATQQAKRVKSLVANDDAFCEQPEDRFKVWPTNRDRPAFHDVMGAAPPVNYDALAHKGARLVEAHRYFAEQARAWLRVAGVAGAVARAVALEKAVRDLLQLVVIDLTADENAQEIFETLNARGAQLTAADLIKNFVFQRIVEEGGDVEAAYDSYWREFETGFWETEISSGRVRQPRASVFLNHWLIARTGEEVVAREVFSRFKQYALFDAGKSMGVLLREIHRAAAVYRRFVEDARSTVGPLDRVGLFAYRTSVLESEVIKPLILVLLDPELAAVPADQLRKALDVVESWLVRRMLVRATTKSYTQVVAELVTLVRRADRATVGDVLETHFREQTGTSRYWPDDDEVVRELEVLLAYKRLGRGRLRMVLEAVEDHLRGWKGAAKALGNERVARGSLAIEHILPRKWQSHWTLTAGVRSEAERDRLLHTLGNLTLLTGRLNASISNGPWAGADGKREALQKHDVLMLNRELLKEAVDAWTDDAIRQRTTGLTQLVLTIWPTPEGHRSSFSEERAAPRRRVELVDLIGAGLIAPGATLFAKRKKYSHRTATVLQDGQLDVDGVVYGSPSAAALAITAKSENGWHFFLVDPSTKRRLADVLREYVDHLSVDVDDDESADDEDDDG
jgi:hypothetical protein